MTPSTEPFDLLDFATDDNALLSEVQEATLQRVRERLGQDRSFTFTAMGAVSASVSEQPSPKIIGKKQFFNRDERVFHHKPKPDGRLVTSSLLTDDLVPEE